MSENLFFNLANLFMYTLDEDQQEQMKQHIEYMKNELAKPIETKDKEPLKEDKDDKLEKELINK